MIAGLIPGNGRQEPKTLEPYISLLVDELIALENCQMRDHLGNIIDVKVKLLDFTFDYPAIGNVLHYPGSARSFKECMFCGITGENCVALNKTYFYKIDVFLV